MSEFPFPGLRPFLRHETDIFFGRDEQIDQLLERLDETRFLSIVGPSGCGKSSLVRAGLIAALEAGFLVRAGARWRTATMRPGTAPLRALAEALCDDSALGPERQAANAASFAHATLRRGPRGLLEMLDETPLPQRTSLLLLVDQFEEIFRYRRDGNAEEAEAFVALLLATVADPRADVYIVTTMRSDFLDDCTLFHGLPEATNQSQFLTPRLTRDQIRACIEGPAGVFGGSIEPALANRILNDMGDDPDQLPLMQHALMRMWLASTGRSTGVLRKPDLDAEPQVSPVFAPGEGPLVTLDDYEQVGTLAEALSNHADEAFESLDEEGQRIAEVMFRCLSDRGAKRRDTRRPTRLGEVAAVAAVEPEAVMAVVEVFRMPGRSFVTPPAGEELTPDSMLDISHESLIRQWGRMTGWVDAETRSGETYRRLEETARLWKRHLAAPWRRPDLDLALTWKVLENPTLEWSKRYGDDFELAMEFLDESEKARAERKAEEEKARENELEQARALAEAEKKRADAESRLAQEHVGVIKRQRLYMGIVALAAIAAVIGGTIAWKLAQDIRRQGRALTESRLSTQALLTLESNPTLAVLLAAEARRGLADDEANSAETVGGRRLLTTLSGFYNVRTLGETLEDTTSADGVRDTAFAPTTCPEGETLAEIDRTGVFRLYNSLEVAETIAPPDGFRPTHLAISRDCRWIAVLQAGTDSDRIVLRGGPAAATAPELTLDAGGRVLEMVFSEDGSRLGVAHGDGARVWHVQSDDPSSPLDLGEPATGITFDLQGLRAATIDGRFVSLWDLGTESRSGSYEHDRPVTRVAFSPTTTGTTPWLGVASGTAAHLWNLTPGSEDHRIFRGHRALITDLAFSPLPGEEDYWLATSSLDSTVRLWDLGRFLDDPRPGRTPKEMPHPKGVLTIAFRPPDGRWLATGGEDDLARVWDISTLATSEPLRLPHGEAVTHLSFSADGRRLATSSGNRPTRIWQLEQPTALPHVVPYDGKIPGLAFAPGDGDTPTLATASRYQIRFLDDFSPDFFHDPMQSGSRTLAPVERPEDDLQGKFSELGFDASGRRLVSRSETGVVDIYRRGGAGGFERQAGLRGTRAAINWSTSGDTVVTVLPQLNGDHQIWSWQGEFDDAGEPVERLLRVAPNEVAQVAIGGRYRGGPRWLAASGFDGLTRLWYLPDETSSPLEIPHDSRVSTLAFDAQGAWLVIGYWDDAAQLYRLSEPADGNPAAAAHAHTLHHRDAVRVIAFSPDSALLATGSGDHLARLWSVPDTAAERGKHELIELFSLSHRDAVLSLAFSRDGKWLATGSLDNQVRILPLYQAGLETVACRAAGRNLTPAEWATYLPDRERQPMCPEAEDSE